MNFQSLVEIAPWTLIAQICNLLIQAALFKKYLFAPVQNILHQRQEQVRAIYDSAEKAEKTAKQSQETYEQLLADAKKEASELVRSASVTAQARGEELVREARAESAVLFARAEAGIAQEKRKAVSDAKGEISAIAMELAEKVVGRELREADHQRLVEEFLVRLGEEP